MSEKPTRREQKEAEERLAAQRRAQAARTACVVGAFSVIVIGVLAWNSARMRTADPLNSAKLTALRSALGEQPNDEDLKSQIRTVDFRLRQEHFRRQRVSNVGGYLLLAGLVALLSCLKAAVPPATKRSFRTRVEEERCKGCGFCIEFCPQEVLELSKEFNSKGYHPPQVIDDELCSGCQMCHMVCPDFAVFIEQPDGREQGKMPLFSDRTRPALIGASAVLLVAGLGVLLPGRPAFLQQLAKPAEKGAFPTEDEVRAQWPQFRGPFGLGVSKTSQLPDPWTGDDILWKTEIPLPGNNSPLVWDDNVFLSGGNKDEGVVYCLDAKSGAIRWQTKLEVESAPAPEDWEPMEDTGYATPTCATDGKHVYAMFVNGDIAAVDYSGKQVWARSLGFPDNAYGHASSLAIFEDQLFVLLDQAGAEDGKSALLALDTATGRTKWKKPRPVPNSWASPSLVDGADTKQVITVADPWVIAYDARTGEELWKSECMSGEIVPSPAAGAGFAFVIEPSRRVVALPLDKTGVLDEEAIAWEADEGIPEITSPVGTDELLYTSGDDGWLLCYDAKTGEKIYEQELDMMMQASPILVGDKLLFTGHEGESIIVAAGREFKVLGRCSLDVEEEVINATPAPADGKLFIRGIKHLYCVGQQ